MAARKDNGADDDYWGSSTAQKIGKKKNLFSDDVSVEDAKQLLKKVDFGEDDDECDTITWDGTPVNTPNTRLDITTSSARYRATSTPPGSLSKATGVSHVPTQPIGRPSFTQSVIGSSSQSYTNQSISDVVGVETASKKGPPSHSEIAKLEAQINFLKRELHGTKRDRFALYPAKDMVKRMIAGEAYSLECYRSKEDKLLFLDEAIRLHDGNVITAAVLFLKDSIKHAIFQRELLARPIATEHYLHYLKQHFEFEKLVDMLAYLGRTEEAAMIKYRQAISVTSPETKIRTLQTCQRTHFNMDAYLNHESAMIQEYVNLLERQLPVEQSDATEANNGATKFRENPRKASIVDQPVITTLYYACFYHYQLTENSLASPIAIKNAHKLTDRQYVWVALAARSKLKQWRDIEALFQTKGWLGGTKIKAVVPFERVVTLLQKLGAPREVMDKYCNFISDTRQRIEIGQKLGCHGSVIETYFHMKDRQAIVNYQHKLKPNSQEWYFASDMLRNTSVKWKN